MVFQEKTYAVKITLFGALKKGVGGSDIQLISVVKQIFFIDKSKYPSKII